MAELLSSSKPFPFLSLLPELRTMIYLACTNDFADNGDSLTTFPGSYWSHLSYLRARKAKFNMNSYLPLLETCRQIRLEATPIFDNHGQYMSSISQTCTFLESIGRLRRAQLRRLSFVYHPTPSNFQHGHSHMLEYQKSAVRCFRLISKDCHNLQELMIHMDEPYVRRYKWMVGCRGHCPMYACVDDDNNVFDINERPGILELRAIRGIKKAKFVPICGRFSEDFESTLNEFASEMMQPRKDR